MSSGRSGSAAPPGTARRPRQPPASSKPYSAGLPAALLDRHGGILYRACSGPNMRRLSTSSSGAFIDACDEQSEKIGGMAIVECSPGWSINGSAPTLRSSHRAPLAVDGHAERVCIGLRGWAGLEIPHRSGRAVGEQILESDLPFRHDGPVERTVGENQDAASAKKLRRQRAIGSSSANLPSSISMRAAAARDRLRHRGDAEECVARDRQLASTSRQPRTWSDHLGRRARAVLRLREGAGVDIGLDRGRRSVFVGGPHLLSFIK